MRIGRFIIASAITTISGLLISTTAYAAEKPVDLKASHVGVTAAGFGPPICTGPLATPPGPNFDGWHFVLPASTGDDFKSVTINFTGGVTAGPITAIAPAQNSGAGWVGFLDNAGMGGGIKHAYVFTTPPGLATAASTAIVIYDSETGEEFNLSHTCPANGKSPSGPVPSGGAETGGGGSYGVTVLGISAIAVAAGAGVVLLLARRRNEFE